MSEATIKKLQESIREHRRKLETDPEYRKKYEEAAKKVDEMLKYLGNDTDD